MHKNSGFFCILSFGRVYCKLMMKSLIRKPYYKYLRSLIELAFIIFLFYSNLLMGEFNKSGNARNKGFFWAINDIFTLNNFLIALVAAFIGYVVFEFLRRKI
jgi:hypothetical protein